MTLKRISNHLVSAASALVVILNLGFWLAPLTAVAIVKFLLRVPFAQRTCNIALEGIYRAAAAIDSFWMTQVMGLEINAIGQLPDHPSPIVVCNHQSWFDIPVIQQVITGQGPIIKFLVKRELMWVPIVGWICYALNFPRLRRGKGEGARQQDYAAIEALSSSLQAERGALLIFAEGTRFTEAKRAAQASPYRHLLKPKPGGLKIALEAAPPGTPVVDTTIIYHGDTNFWRCLHGAARRITAQISVTPSAEIGEVQDWLDERWRQKDREISRLASRGGPGVPLTC